jgi:hypothetical protein
MSELSSKIILTESEKDVVYNALLGVKYDPIGSPNYIQSLRKIAYKNFPDRVLDTLNLLNNNEKYAVIVENLPSSNVGKIPFKGEVFEKDFISENIILAFASIIGEPYSISAEGDSVVNNLIPYKETKYDYTGLGSESELDFHIENSALNFLFKYDNLSPSALLLLGIASNHGNPVKTKFVDARKVLSLMEEEDLKLLRGENFTISVPYRWRSYLPKDKLTIKPVPMVSGNLENPRVFFAFYSDVVKPLSEQAGKSLLQFRNKVNELACYEVLTAGKLLLLNNKYTLHARESFTPEYSADGRPDRWIQRVFVSRDISSFYRIKVLRGRIYEPWFQDD